MAASPGTVRLLDLVAPLALASDAGNGQPPETAFRCTLVALALAEACGVGGASRRDVLWAGLLRFAGCTSTSVEESWFGGDDLALRGALLGVDFADPDDAARRLDRGLEAMEPAPRGRAIGDFFARAPELAPEAMRSHCDVAVRLAERLGMPPGVGEALSSYHERWDGNGSRRLAGDAIPIVARLLTVGQAVVAVGRAASAAELREILRKRAGGALDPALVDAFLADERRIVEAAAGPSVWDRVVAAEAGPPLVAPLERLPALVRVLGDYANLKSPFLLGHAQGVACLTVRAAREVGLDADAVQRLELAALVHDIGRVSVPNGIWDKPGELGPVERDRVREHSLSTERILAVSPALRPLARLAGSDHERVDGGGYHRGLSGMALAREARLLAAADVYQALLEPRPHRPARSPAEAAAVVRDEAGRGALDREATSSVLACAGHAAAPRAWPASLTNREVEVLRCLTRGLTNKEIAAAMDISPRTVQQHTLHIYDKIGVSTRAAAALYATEHDLYVPR